VRCRVPPTTAYIEAGGGMEGEAFAARHTRVTLVQYVLVKFILFLFNPSPHAGRASTQLPSSSSGLLKEVRPAHVMSPS
jgi:hypothetical protein